MNISNHTDSGNEQDNNKNNFIINIVESKKLSNLIKTE